MHKNIIVTASNSPYFESLRTLIGSLHKHSFDLIDEIVVYNLGLSEEELNCLNRIEKVKVKSFDITLPFPDYLKPKQHAYKLYCVYNEQFNAKNIFWLDAGVMILQDIKEIFDIIENEDIFLVGDTHLNINFTKRYCAEVMKATDKELHDVQLSSGILGYKSGGKYQELINQAYEYSKIEGVVNGDEENHRHDQSVYSILASRWGCKKYDIDRYGYWTNIHKNIHTAIQSNAVIFVHRRGHYDLTGIKYKS